MRFDDRVTGALKDFAPNAKIIHIDIDPAEIGKNVQDGGPDRRRREDGPPAARAARPARPPRRLARLARRHAPRSPVDRHPGDRQAAAAVRHQAHLRRCPARRPTTSTGVGQHQMWAAQYFWGDKPYSLHHLRRPRHDGLRGAGRHRRPVRRPKDTVWAFCGDGGFQMTSQELALCAEYELPIKFAIINNGYLGMVRQWQELFYTGTSSPSACSSPTSSSSPRRWASPASASARRRRSMARSRQRSPIRAPCCIDFEVEDVENTYPMVPPGVASRRPSISRRSTSQPAEPERVR